MKIYIGIVCCFAFFSSASYGEIYKWVDENGRPQFSNIKPAASAAGEIQEVKVNGGNFVEQDPAQLVRTQEFLDARQAKREQEKKDSRAAYERSRPYAPRTSTGDIEAEQARLRDARNMIRNSPHSAPRARQAPRAR
ncbi:MAG: DUF4124 domain-containing protein [Pseudomonadota bacterium]